MTKHKDSSTSAKNQHRQSKSNQAAKEFELTGFQVPDVDIDTELDSEEVVRSALSDEVAVQSAQLLELTGNEGSIIFYPKAKDFAVGDVLYLRDKNQSVTTSDSLENETGLIVQIVSKGIASYPQADSKALFRLLTTAHAREMQRSYNEPREVIDEFLIGEFIVRASVQSGNWKDPEGKVVTRNVDIFLINPAFILEKVVKSLDELNLDLGTLGANQKHPVRVYAGGFEKVNLITGMKGGGKSHITKGIIHLQRKLGMPSIVFDINGEYGSLPKANRIRPTVNLKFRLDQLPIPSIFKVFEKLSLFNTAATDNAVRANLPGVIEDRNLAGEFADLQFLLEQEEDIIGANDHMLGAYRRGIRNLMSYHLFCTSKEAQEEENALRENRTPTTRVVSLRTVLYRMAHGIEDEGHQQAQNANKPQNLEDLKNYAGVIVFDIGGLSPVVQKVVVTLVIDQMKEICRKQYESFQKNKVEIPIYPSVFFEEAHMYMDEGYIDELIPLIRHLGINLFFVTNTPGALPDSVFRLVDNVIMTRMVNQQDINKVVSCGLADKKTIEGFARDLPKYHNLFLSTSNGATNNFPLVFLVRDFTAPVEEGGEGLPKSGITRSMWEVISQKVETDYSDDQQ
ncbi:helicase HerA domain-containing protein [Coleofasciculus sp. F4-SAH-05]|uniref:helicase HerA domain-containing protein n=1 Tax=Coleofasciculus sp. F4-SAH-05 TaxID=3069525 RepID=UPI0032F15A97